MLRTPTTNISKTYWIVANTSAIIISYIGAALSVLWIIMVKGMVWNLWSCHCCLWRK